MAEEFESSNLMYGAMANPKEISDIENLIKEVAPETYFLIKQEVPFSHEIQEKMNKFYKEKMDELREYKQKLFEQEYGPQGNVLGADMQESMPIEYEKFCKGSGWGIAYASESLPKPFFNQGIIKADLITSLGEEKPNRYNLLGDANIDLAKIVKGADFGKLTSYDQFEVMVFRECEDDSSKTRNLKKELSDKFRNNL